MDWTFLLLSRARVWIPRSPQLVSETQSLPNPTFSPNSHLGCGMLLPHPIRCLSGHLKSRRTNVGRYSSVSMVGVAIGLVALIPVPKGLAEEEPTQPEPTTEEKLRAEAKVILKEKVQPFVRKYCTDCHGSRPEAGINLESALKDPGTTSASLHWRKAVANVRVHDCLLYTSPSPRDIS